MQAAWNIRYASMRKSARICENMADCGLHQIRKYFGFVRAAAAAGINGLLYKNRYVLAAVSAVLLGIVFSVYGIYKIRNIDVYTSIAINPYPDNSLIDAGIKLDAKCRLWDSFSSLKDIYQDSDHNAEYTLFREKSDTKAEPLHESAPSVVLKALAVLGQDGVCTLDIDGEAPGKIFRSGDIFGSGRGKINAIDSKGVEWEWLGQRHRIDF